MRARHGVDGILDGQPHIEIDDAGGFAFDGGHHLMRLDDLQVVEARPWPGAGTNRS